ncbi:hypothetical protein QYF61_023351 [Mycteria americana]|uniref:Uncharacterized protein n=1 Tax=Mycteria americana TaxID=33587 RepID=A0AAN7MRZ0_MYCAM|nr:hypothetical protein QYF61_023351 [Mycteria americana]
MNSLLTDPLELVGILKKTEELLEVEKAKADSRSQNLKFLKDKSEDLKIRIKTAEVDGRNFLTRFCDGMAQSWLVWPKIVVRDIPGAS